MPGVVDEHAHRAERRFRGIESARHRGIIRRIGLDRDRGRADLTDEGIEPRLAPRDAHDLRPIGSQHARKSRTETGRRAGHERDLARQVE